MHNVCLTLCIAGAVCFTTFTGAAAPRAEAKPRLLVLTDIGGDPDDTQSLVRLLTYANEFEIEGLVASAAGVPGELQEAAVRPELIRQVVEAYGEVQPNLLKHAPGFPPKEQLLACVKSGNPRRGVASLGEGKNTEGSDWIIQAADRSDPRPLNVVVWGGSTELAQALWRVRRERKPEEVRRFLSRLRVYAISHQDNTGPWIVENFPELFYILGAKSEQDVLGQSKSGLDRRLSVYRGMYLGGDESLTSREWLDTHVRRNHGPLGALYPDRTWTAPNPHSALKEGDTPSWFHFLPTGLGDVEHPEWGGWGGRFRLERGRLYRDAEDTVDGVTDARAGVWRWRPHYQADFQARMDWCMQPPDRANHPPVPAMNGDRTRRAVMVDARPGATVRLSARGSKDPDGDRLAYRWWIYPEAGTYGGTAAVEPPDAAEAAIKIPADAAGKTLHVILETTDDGEPALTRYRRAVLRVRE